MVHGSPLMEMKRSKLRSKDCRPGDSTAFIIHEERMLAGRQDSQNRLQCTELVLRTEESGVTCQVPASPLPLVCCPINHSTPERTGQSAALIARRGGSPPCLTCSGVSSSHRSVAAACCLRPR